LFLAVALKNTWQVASESLNESTQHQNDFSGTVPCLTAIHLI